MGKQRIARKFEQLFNINQQRPSSDVLRDTYLWLNAPRSANRVSTPVNASRIPPSCNQPDCPLRTKKAPAKYGEKAFKMDASYIARFCKVRR